MTCFTAVIHRTLNVAVVFAMLPLFRRLPIPRKIESLRQYGTSTLVHPKPLHASNSAYRLLIKAA
eukprot:scaffold20461_cov117-Cylindrotheca_fusiformis.AAC.11